MAHSGYDTLVCRLRLTCAFITPSHCARATDTALQGKVSVEYLSAIRRAIMGVAMEKAMTAMTVYRSMVQMSEGASAHLLDAS